jgi:DNA-binding NarL/FixJ family response regulator
MSLGTFAIDERPGGKPPRPHRARTVVVDDSLTILHAICSLLEHHELVEIVGRAESGAETIETVLELRPEIVLMDADMPGMSGLRASLLLSQISPAVKVVLMSMDDSPQFRRSCAGCGAYAVIYKPRFLSEFIRLLRERPAQIERAFPKGRRKTAAGIGL